MERLLAPLQSIEPLFYWMEERQRIFMKKEAGEPWPWTEDPILQEYSFCNVFREQDTVTKWIREWMDGYEDYDNYWFMPCLSRHINWPETLDEIWRYSTFPKNWNPAEVQSIMEQRQTRGEKTYTGAYMLSGAGAAGIGKPAYTCHLVLDPVFKAGPAFLEGATLESATKYLEKFYGWGSFLAYEVVTDLRHTKYLESASDILSWANPGPGAFRGLNRLFGRPLDKRVRREQAIEEMQWLMEMAPSYLPDWFPKLEMRDIEHSLCETDKYLRVKFGEGRPRAKYHYKGAA